MNDTTWCFFQECTHQPAIHVSIYNMTRIIMTLYSASFLHGLWSISASLDNFRSQCVISEPLITFPFCLHTFWSHSSLCHRAFKTSQGLGDHTRIKHAGMSILYVLYTLLLLCIVLFPCNCNNRPCPCFHLIPLDYNFVPLGILSVLSDYGCSNHKSHFTNQSCSIQ